MQNMESQMWHHSGERLDYGGPELLKALACCLKMYASVY